MTPRMLAVAQCRRQNAFRVVSRHRPIGDPASRRLHLDERLQPIHPARTVADDLDSNLAALCRGGQSLCHLVGADRDSARITRNEDS